VIQHERGSQRPIEPTFYPRGRSLPTFRPQQLLAVARRLFVAAGVPAADAETVAGSLVDSNLCGHDSHGVIRVQQYVGCLRDGKLHAGVSLDTLRETPALLAADGNWGLGQVQAYRLLDRLMAKAKTVGIASGTIRRCGHIGRLGEYAEWAADRGTAFFATVNSHGCGQRVAPPGGTKGRISTNPVCFGAPTPTNPLVLDFSTSACAEGKVRVAYQKGVPVPEGWIQDVNGVPSTDPSVLYCDPPGTILPFGGAQTYKGFGLGFMLDALVGGLSGGESSRPDRPMSGVGNSVLFTLWDVDAFGGREHFLATVGGLSAYVRDTPRAAGVDRIVLPGDPEREARERRRAEGLAIPDGTWAILKNLGDELGINVEGFV
jgi:hydroxycarboxylate dehydrogenase B